MNNQLYNLDAVLAKTRFSRLSIFIAVYWIT
jgi:hypothetical protein